MFSPYKVFFLFTGQEDAILQAGFGVSSKIFRKATDRNRVKRLTKEAYRVLKPALYQKLQEHNLRLAVFLVYTGRELPVFEEVNRKISLILQRLTNLVNEKTALHP
jgi:ribonuclease P protein component